MDDASVNLEKYGVSDSSLLSRHMLHGVVAFETQMHVLMEVSVPVNGSASFIASWSRNGDGSAFQFRQGEESAQLPNGIKVPAVSEVVEMRNALKRIDLRHDCIVVRNQFRADRVVYSPSS